jgi:RNA methyltransferase, TrmH family
MTGSEELVTSRHNPVVKRARRLRLRKYRVAEGAFLVEGIRAVWQAVDHHAQVERLLWAPELLTSPGARALVERSRDAGMSVTALSAQAFASLTERDRPSGLAAIVRRELGSLEGIEVDPRSVFVALEAPSDPGNIGTIVRTLDATGGGGVVLVGDAADPFDPRAVKASMGSLFAVDLCRAPDVGSVEAWCRARGVTLVTTSAHASTELWDAALAPPLMFLLGSEKTGLTPEQLAGGTVSVVIPMAGSASSLNLAVAAGVLLYECRRRAARRKESR